MFIFFITFSLVPGLARNSYIFVEIYIYLLNKYLHRIVFVHWQILIKQKKRTYRFLTMCLVL